MPSVGPAETQAGAIFPRPIRHSSPLLLEPDPGSPVSSLEVVVSSREGGTPRAPLPEGMGLGELLLGTVMQVVTRGAHQRRSARTEGLLRVDRAV